MVAGRVSKTPKKATTTPAKIKQSPAKSPDVESIKQEKPIMARMTPVSTRKRGLLSQDLPNDEEEIDIKKGKPSLKGGKSLSVKAESDDVTDELNDSKDDSDDEEMELGSGEEDDNEEEDDDEEMDSNEEDDDDKPSETKGKAKKSKKELTEIPKIVVTNLKPGVTPKDLIFHFKNCGKIEHCKLQVAKNGKKTKAFIQFKELAEAKCAVALKNAKPFRGKPIQVELCKVAHQFTNENSIIVKGFPTGVLSKHLQEYTKKTMESFGSLGGVRMISKNEPMAIVSFNDNEAVSKLLQAGNVEIMGKQVQICEYTTSLHSSPDSSVFVYGLTSAIKEEDISEALSKHCNVGKVFIGKNKMGQMKSYATADVQTEESAQKLLAMKTIKVKNVALDILPLTKSKYFFNSDTGVFFRHPSAVFVENLNSKTQEKDLKIIFSCFGYVERINFINRKRAAMIVYDNKESAKKALAANIKEVCNSVVRVHSVDGVYKPGELIKTLNEKSTVYLWGIKEKKHIPDLIKKIRETGVNFTRFFPVSDCLTKVFNHACIAQYDTEAACNAVLSAELKIHDYVVKAEKFNANKHDFVTQNTNVIVENLNEDTKEVDLWKSLQSFGEVTNATILRVKNLSIGCAYVEFKNAAAAEKAITTGTIDLKGQKVLIVRPTRDVVDKLKKRAPDAFYSKEKFRPNFKAGKVFKKGPRPFAKKPKSFNKNPHAIKKTTSFKKNTRRAF